MKGETGFQKRVIKGFSLILELKGRFQVRLWVSVQLSSEGNIYQSLQFYKLISTFITPFSHPLSPPPDEEDYQANQAS